MAREMKNCASREQSHAGMNSAEVQPIFERKLKDSGVKWIGEIPTNWLSASVGHLFRIKAGGDAKPDLYEYEYDDEHIYPVYTNTLDKNQVYAYSSKAYFHGPCITVTGRGAVGHAIYRENAFDAIIRLLVLTPRMKVSCRYYTYFIDYVCHFFTNNATIGQLSAEQIFPAKVCRPPLSEQQAIADFLDKKCAEIDGLLADLDAEVKTLAEYKKSIIAETVTRGLNPNAPMKQSGIPWAETIPAHWTTEKGKYLFVLRRTKGNPHNLELMSPTQKFGVIPQSQVEGVVLVKEKTDLNTFRTIRPGDFCISLRSFQGGFEYSKYEGVVSPAYQVFYPIKPIADGYFKYMLKSDGFISYINTFSMSLRDGKNIAFEDFGNSYIPTPPIEEQEAIAAYLNKKCAMIDQSTADKQTQIETLKSYKSSLIYEYVTGKKQVI